MSVNIPEIFACNVFNEDVMKMRLPKNIYRALKRTMQNNEPLADIDIVGKTFMPAFDELKIDLVFTAHQHTYRRHDHIYNFAPADHGPVYIDTGVAGNCRFDVPRTQRFDKIMLPQPETDNYLVLEGNMSSLTVKCFLPDGTLMDTCVLTNSKQ